MTHKDIFEVASLATAEHRIELLEEELNQTRVQLAGCLTAAEGSTKEVATQGDYGWSPAYQAVLDLRRKYDTTQSIPGVRVTRVPSPGPEIVDEAEDDLVGYPP